ncbi:MAG: hypothetical protein CL816_02310 [Coxiellaceae bacterium]|nr:hypothetical protein [Coxiellaceae bacterium]
MMILDKKNSKQFLMLFLTGLISYFVMNTANAYLVRVLGHASYGDFSLTIGLIFSLTPFFSVGITSLLTKFLPIYMKNPSEEKTSIFLKWNTKVLQRSFIVVLIVIIAAVFLRATHLNESINKHIPCLVENCIHYRHFFFDLFFLIPVVLLLIWNTSLLNATKNALSANILGQGSITYVCALVIFIFDIYLESIGHYQLLSAIFIGFFILCIAQYSSIYFAILKPEILSISQIRKQTVPHDTSSFYLKTGIGLMLNSIIYVAMGLITMLMIEWLSPNEVVLGHYVIISKISAIYGVLSGAIRFLVAPHLSGLENSDRLSSLQKFINLQAIAGLLWLAFCIAVLLLFKGPIFKAYSINFDHATFAIILLMSGSYLFSLTGISESICLYNDMNKALYPISILQFLTIGILCYFMIPLFSYLGAIYAYLISEICCSTICWILLRYHGIRVKIFGFV